MADQVYDSNGQLVDVAHTQNATDKKCPQCDGVMSFDPASGGLKCPFCGHVEAVQLATAVNESDEVITTAQELDFGSAEKTENCNWGVAKKTVICKNCGGEAVYDALQIAGTCPYCGSQQVMESHDVNTLAPGGVCPFRVSKDQALDLFKKWIKGKWFAPKKAKESASPEGMNGLYLPYWTFDADTSTEYKAKYGIDKTYTDSDGDTHTTTDWYNTKGEYSEFIDDYLIMATSRHNPSVLKDIEPFNTAENVIYKPEYVSGFVTERYSLGLKDAWEKAKGFIISRLKDHISALIKKEKHADHVKDVKMSTEFDNVTYKYLLLPVWSAAYTYEGKVYEFMVNGQTGKVGGKYPVSVGKVILTILIVLVCILVCAGFCGLFN